MRPGRCPVCDEPNCCRLETGEAYKGRCWCERLTLPAAVMRRLAAQIPEPRCLCPQCLAAIAAHPGSNLDEQAAQRAGGLPPGRLHEGDYYLEGGAFVFTAQYHLRRGYCCGSGCRHCPYGGRT